MADGAPTAPAARSFLRAHPCINQSDYRQHNRHRDPYDFSLSALCFGDQLGVVDAVLPEYFRLFFKGIAFAIRMHNVSPFLRGKERHLTTSTDPARRLSARPAPKPLLARKGAPAATAGAGCPT